MIKKSKIKEKMHNNEVVLQAMLRLPEPAIAEVIAMSGIDFITIDGEHFAFNDETIIDIIRAVNLHGAECMLRVNDLNPSYIAKVMDFGLTGILVPHVETYEEAMQIVHAVKFGPIGTRGFCPIARANYWGMRMNPQEFAKLSNENTVVALMIETKLGIENLDKILTIPEIDMISIGPSDLANSYGFPGQNNHPVVVEAMNAANKKIVASGKSLCVLTYTPEIAKAALKEGRTNFHLGSDLQILTKNFTELVREVKALY